MEKVREYLKKYFGKKLGNMDYCVVMGYTMIK